ncbi:MAG: hypothetical protein IPH94_19770 [Saprospiraceae bacterium]|nr:hypothetical protein [Haliscomenobacter sp.]MBK7223453.1 hypothetical protein [Saprospiraceae bacterium]MBK8878405.1 hypothetical protein [Haliscomenobacter sp.]
MKFNLPLFAFLLFQVPLHAQLGLHGGIRFSDAPEWNILDQSNNRVTELPGTGWSAGIDYAFRLPNTRIEFLPELNFAAFQADVIDLGGLDARFYSGFLNVNVYILDLKGDCDCPTWSKSGNTLTKGLFLQLSPGFSLLHGNIQTTEILYKGRSTNLSLALGAGLDLGVSERLTVTPYAGVRYFPNAIWPGLEEAIARDISIGDRVTHNESPLTQIYAGLRLGLQIHK